MGSQRFFGCLIVMLMGLLLGSSRAYKFQVGGKEGWVLHPKEDYNQWAGRSRFHVNDTLHFKYKKGSDSVLIVSKDDYHLCNTQNAEHSLTDGDSIFKFNRSGPFFFIGGNADNCKKGQKLMVIVMALRHQTHPPAAPQAPSPMAAPAVSPSPPTSSPSPLSPPAESPQSAPAVDRSGPSEPPYHPKSGQSKGFTRSVGLVLGASFGVSVILGGLVGLV